ncbi:MAG: DUF4139 domain-containing protein [Anaerolineae bacterium]
MKHKRWWIWSTLAVLALLGAGLGGGRPASPVAAQGQGLELAVYNQDLALVKDRRSMDLAEGLNEVRFTNVASRIDPTSVHFRSLADPEGTVVLEQNYEYDIVGSAKLLQKYIDMEISVVTEDGQEYTGTLLSGADDVILQAADGQVTVLKLGQIKEFSFPALPDGLITRPTLVWLLQSAQGGSQDVEVTYLTNGINWEANYIVVLANDEQSLDLDGWVTLDNRSGTAYENATLKLIAGDIHRAATDDYAVEKALMYEAAAPAASQVEERSFFEYHLYEVQRPVTVKDQQTKQIEFVTASDVPAEKFFVYDGAQMQYWGVYQPVEDPSYGTASNKKVMVMIEFTNGEEQGLGVPLPKGTLRVYKNDVDGSTLLVGEDAIDHTPKDEQVRLYVGDAFDIVGERVQTDFQVDYDDDWMEESYEITLRNHKEEDIEVRVVEHMFRWTEWQILESSHDFEKMDAQTIEFRVPVEADGEAVVTYTVRYEW